MRLSAFGKAAVTAALILLSAATALAQVQAGRIVGTVYDPTRAVVPGASIVVTETETNIQHRVTSGANGTYAVTPLDPGRYSVSAGAEGFQTSVRSGITLQVGQAVVVDVELTLGETTTLVEVSAEIPLLETETGTLGQVIDNEKIVNLPLNGRNYYELLRLATGAAFLPGTGHPLRIRPAYINGTTISGVSGRQVTFLMDGADITEQHLGGTFIQTSVDALQEFKVQQNAYSAEFARAGGLLNVSTKSGTNRFHGSAFEFLRNDKLDAREFFQPEREILKRNQFRATIGGPLISRDKMFFFFSYEGTRQSQGLAFNNIVPTEAMKQGDFSASDLSTIHDPLSTAADPQTGKTIRTPFANNTIPQNRLSPQALFFNDFIPGINTASGTAAFAPSRALNLDQFTVRIDRVLGDKHRAFGRYSFHDYGDSDPNSFPALGNADLLSRGQNVAVSLTSTLSPTVIHEARFSFMPSTIDLLAYLQGTDFNALAGITGFEDTLRPDAGGAFPDFSWSGYSAMDGHAFDQRPKTQDRESYSYTDNLTWVRGSHILKFGARIHNYFPLFTDSKQYAGDWQFTGINTENPAAGGGDAFADWMLGLPRSGRRAFPGNTFGGRATYWHFFVHDDFKISPKLTVNLGLRYEYTPWLKGYRGQLGAFDPTQERSIIIASETDQIDLDAQFAAPTAFPLFQDIIQTSSQAGLPINITDNDMNQWAPRFGFAYRPFENTVIRGGYGIFYEAEISTGRVNLNMVPFKLDEQVFNNPGAVPERSIDNFFLGRPIGSASTAPSISPTKTQLRMGYDQHWNFGIQQQLTTNSVFEVDYVGNKGSFLGAGNAFNDPLAGPGGVQDRRPFQRFGSINLQSHDGSSIYHSIQTKFEKRQTAGFWYLFSYTFSKNIDHFNSPQLGSNWAWERSLAGSDIPHNLSFALGYALPFGRGRRLLPDAGGLLDAFVGGWQVQSLMGIRSGRPFTPTISGDRANIGRGGQRPIRLSDGALDNPTVELWFDKDAFAVPDRYTFGNSGGNILREDAFEFIDFSIMKDFRVAEGHALQFRAEFFNLTNTPNFQAPSSSINTGSGGRVTGTLNQPRQIQFGLKYIF